MANSELGQWFAAAKRHGWRGLGDLYESARRVHGEVDIDCISSSGFWYCDNCSVPLIDVCVYDDVDGNPVCLYSRDGLGTVYLCQECHEAAVEARAKIVVGTDDEAGGTWEDDSALTDEERRLAGYLDAADAGESRICREIIRSYPRDEQMQLRRYQDRIDADRRRAGKQTANREA